MPSNRRLSLLAIVGTAFAVLALAACKKVPTTPVVVSGFIIVQGNGQTAQAGQQLATPLVLRVVDADWGVSD